MATTTEGLTIFIPMTAEVADRLRADPDAVATIGEAALSAALSAANQGS